MDRNSAFVALLIVSVAVSGTANNFAARIKAQLLGDYNFVCVVPDSIVQLAFNAIVLAVLAARKKVDRSQFEYVFRCGSTWVRAGAWKFLVLAGVNDIANNVTGLAAQPYLSTFMMSLMDQATTPFTVFFSVLILKTRYNALETVAVLVIVSAAVSCVLIAHADNSQETSEFWAFFAAATTSFAALSFVLKEITFNGYQKERREIDARQPPLRIQLQQTQFAGEQQLQQRLNDEPRPSCDADASPECLNVFLVGAVINFVGLLSSVPIALINYAAVNSGSPWQAMQEGLHFLFERDDAFRAWAIYIVINTTFNVCLILTTGYGSALLSFLSLKLAVPLTAILSAVPWPVIGAKPLNSAEWAALVVLLGGITAFRVGNMKREKEERQS